MAAAAADGSIQRLRDGRAWRTEVVDAEQVYRVIDPAETTALIEQLI